MYKIKRWIKGGINTRKLIFYSNWKFVNTPWQLKVSHRKVLSVKFLILWYIVVISAEIFFSFPYIIWDVSSIKTGYINLMGTWRILYAWWVFSPEGGGHILRRTRGTFISYKKCICAGYDSPEITWKGKVLSEVLYC